MDPLTLALVLGGLAIAGTSYPKSENPAQPLPPQNDPKYKELENEVIARVKDASKITIPDFKLWHPVQYQGETYLVAPHYIAPVGIGEAAKIAKAQGYELPTKGLVDAIYQAADLKLDPLERGPSSKPPNDYTYNSMNPLYPVGLEANIDQLARIQRQIEKADPDRQYKLLGGTHKDIIYDKIPFGEHAGEMTLGIYGWHRRNGKPIQDMMWGHNDGRVTKKNPGGDDWKDYSQGLRLVKKVSAQV